METEILEVIEVLTTVTEAEKRIPDSLRGVTFFGENDWWLYMKSYSPNMCHQCDFYGEIKQFSGSMLRGDFPYLEIVDEDTIEPRVHPHCACLLLRMKEPPEE